MNAGVIRRLSVFIPLAGLVIWVTYVVLTRPAPPPDAIETDAVKSDVAGVATRPSNGSAQATTRPARMSTRRAESGLRTRPSTQGLGPDVVMLKELVSLYEPVPFDHRTHAQMAQMWDGCVTCHHRTPDPTTRPTTGPSTRASTLPVRPWATTHPTEQMQDASVEFPACKSCHAISAQESDIYMPSLKGAYHRQCLNCHKEWMHGNACVICHKPRGEQKTTEPAPTRDDIVGRMHPPIPEPETKLYKMRYTPADGGHVLFRHKEHTERFGLRCVDCHRQDNCSHCHDPNGDKAGYKPVKPGMTWSVSHGPCMSCHEGDHCQHCHFKDEQAPPAPFEHAMTGQELDKDHASLKCTACHSLLKVKSAPTCGNAGCHPKRPVAFPADRPGRLSTTRPAWQQPTTRKLSRTRPGDLRQ